ncbi:MAG: glycosyltransferase family 2 protein [Clostridiales bacterium]|nr:glycosyltransferase family 2 protein [Clostridiales bacterium]
MKVLSIAVPCYNSQEYMKKCIDSLLVGGDEVEILVVDDGSRDDTLKIAREYEEQYPGIVKAIHQENKGHGGAVNTGLANATGLYFKVVDSDDWLNEEAYRKALDTLKACIRGPRTLDLLICNYVYEKVGAKRKAVMRYDVALPQERIFGWEDVKSLGYSHYLLMHSMIYRTELLRECGLVLPEHTFYVDNLVAFVPLSMVNTMYYLDVNLYRYFIGREDQSVSENVMIGRIDQQIRVNKLMIDHIARQKNLNKKQRDYMLHMLTMITTVSTIFLIKSKTEENYEKKKELWRYLKDADKKIYLSIRLSLLGRLCNLPGKGGRQVSVAGYKIVQKIYGFN